jgi:hypothetical protein
MINSVLILKCWLLGGYKNYPNYTDFEKEFVKGFLIMSNKIDDLAERTTEEMDPEASSFEMKKLFLVSFVMTIEYGRGKHGLTDTKCINAWADDADEARELVEDTLMNRGAINVHVTDCIEALGTPSIGKES